MSSTLSNSLLANILSEESFRPAEPNSVEETGISSAIIEDLILKYVLAVGSATGRAIAEKIALPFGILEEMFQSLRQRQLLVHSAAAQLGDYYYALTEEGRRRGQQCMNACNYVGPAPVPLEDYITSVEAQSIRTETPQEADLREAFSGLSVEDEVFDQLGPAVNSGAGLFLYGAPGNGKTTLAERITACFGQDIWVPHALIEDGQFIKFYDAAFHEARVTTASSILKTSEYDPRWIKITRPTVIVGGELTMDALEINHDPATNVSEAPLQLKSNCGCLLIDDFGRQKMEPMELLNRWIVPLENRHDFLTIGTGKKIQVPFDQLIIFSTNLEPNELADDAFLRRIPYKIEVGDPTRAEFHILFKIFCKKLDFDYDEATVDHLIDTHYHPFKRPLRRCQPRDLLGQIKNFCSYKDIPLEMSPEQFDRVVKSYFTVLKGD